MTPLCPTCGQSRLSTYSMERIRSDMPPGLRRVYLAIVELWRELGAFPTTEMVADRVGLRSRRTVFVHLHRLIEKGYVSHAPEQPPSHRYRLRVQPEGEPMPTKTKTAAKKPAKKSAKKGVAPPERILLTKQPVRSMNGVYEMTSVHDGLSVIAPVDADAPLTAAERDLLMSMLRRVLGHDDKRQPSPPLTRTELMRECRKFASQALAGIVGDGASEAWIETGDDDDEPSCEIVELSEDLERFVVLRLGVTCVD
jgi:hypothetical protein